jgi:hypothetical protein
MPSFYSQNISFLLTFSLVKVKKTKYQNPETDNRNKKMGVTEEGNYMDDKNKKKAGLPNKKGDGPFVFLGGKVVLNQVDRL